VTYWFFGCLFFLWRFSVSLSLSMLILMSRVGFMCVVNVELEFSQGLTVFLVCLFKLDIRAEECHR
jgi:hypothetical protein